MKIAIIGAGISGLSAAHSLAKRGHKVVVFERSNVPGGLGTYIKIKNNYIERFYHHFFESDNEIKKLAKELGIEKKLKFYRAKTGIFSENKIYPFSSPLNLLQFSPLSFLDRLRCGITIAFLKFIPFPPNFLDGTPAEKWIKKYSGKNVYKKIWGPLLEGKFSKYSNKISSLWLWGRVRDRSLKLGYFDGSVKILFDRLIKDIKKRGGIVKTSSEIESVEIVGEKILIKEGSSAQLFDKAVITTVSPITNLMVKNGLALNLRSKLKTTDQLGAICLILELKHSVQSQYWLNICDIKSKVLVVVEHTNMIDKKYYGGRSIVYLANYIHRDDKRFRMPDEEIIKEYTAILKQINKNYDNSWILKSYVSRVPRAQTIFNTGALDRLPPTNLAQNLYMINIDQMYPHDRNLDQGIELGYKVAELIQSDI